MRLTFKKRFRNMVKAMKLTYGKYTVKYYWFLDARLIILSIWYQ